MTIAHIFFASLSSILSILCFIPYLRDILRGTTRPHPYTWFVWAVLQTIVAQAMWHGGAGIAIASSVIGAVFCALIFLFSLRGGTKYITRFDSICLVGALAAMVAYFFLHNPLLSVIFATLTDVIGTVPTLRKAWTAPRTETASTHLLSSAAGASALAALAVWNFVTVFYVATVTVLDLATGMIVVAKER